MAFIAQNTTLKTVSLSGGEPFTVVAEGVDPASSIDWGPDGLVYFSDSAGAIQRVSARGGQPETIIPPDDSARYTAPEVLPRGKGLLVTVTGKRAGVQAGVGVVSPEGGPVRTLFKGSMIRYVEPGYVVFSDRTGQLMAAGFDPDQRVATSQPVRMMSGVFGYNAKFSEFALSQKGSLVYRTESINAGMDLVWVSREGVEEAIDTAWTGLFHSPSLSPDGTQLAVDIKTQGTGTGLWIRDLRTGIRHRLMSSFLPTGHRPEWTFDGGSVSFLDIDSETGTHDIWTTLADGTTDPQRTLDLTQDIWDPIWSSDGEWVVFEAGLDIMAVRLGGDLVPVTLVGGGYSEEAPALSPDDRFLAYVSNESGQREVYVRPFPNTGDGKWPVSEGGGREPVWGNLWGRMGGELFYRNGDRDLVAVEITTEPEFTRLQEVVLFPASGYVIVDRAPQYDVAPDHKRFLMIRSPGPSIYDLIFVGDFLEDIKARVAR